MTTPSAPSAPPPASTAPVAPHTNFAARGIVVPNFPAFRPRDVRISSKDSCTSVAWSCDGRHLASCGTENKVRVWQPEKSLELRNTTAFSGAHTTLAESVAWSPTHPELMCSSSRKDSKLAFWDIRQPKPVQILTHTRKPLTVQFSPAGDAVLVHDDEDRLAFATFGGGEWRLADAPRGSHAAGSYVCWSNSGGALFVAADGSVKVLEYPSLALLERVGTHPAACYALAVDPRGRYLCTGGTDSIVNFIDLAQLLCVRATSSSDTTVNALAFSYDGEFLAVASDTSYLDLVAVETGVSQHRIPTLTAAAAVAWHPSKHILASCGEHNNDPKLGWISLFGL